MSKQSGLIPLKSRIVSTGLAQRTLKNLNFIKGAYAKGETEVHVVTQILNSLLGLLVFPVEKEREFREPLKLVTLSNPPDFRFVRQVLPTFPLLPSLTVVTFGDCRNLSKFFTRLRNSVSHKNFTFSGDPDSRCLSTVVLTFKDRKFDRKKDAPFDWEVTINVEDLEKLIRYIGEDIIQRQL